MCKYILGTLFWVVFSFSYLPGQIVSSGQGERLLDCFNRRFQELDSLILSSADSVRAGGFCFPVCKPVMHGFYDPRVYEKKFEADLKVMRSQNGFKVSGQTYYRLDEGMGLDEEDAVSRYNAKVQLEVAWDFFRSSCYKYKGKKREIFLENQIEQNQFEQELLSVYAKDAKIGLRVKYESQMAGILLHRIENLNLIYSAYRYLVDEGGASSDELLEILDEKTKAERILATFTGSQIKAGELSHPWSELVSIDTLSLLRDLKRGHSDFKDIEMRTALLDQQYKNTNYLQDASIAPFVRYSQYFRSESSNSANVDVGFRLQLPLTGENNKKRKSIDLEKQRLTLEYFKIEKEIETQVSHIIAEINRFNNLVSGEVRRIRELRAYLADRKKAYDNFIGQYSRPARMKEYNVYLSCWESLVEFQYRRECLLCDLQSLMGDLPVAAYCTRIEL